jgi:hypothetical protein
MLVNVTAIALSGIVAAAFRNELQASVIDIV